MKIEIDSHASARAQERGATREEMHSAIENGEPFPAKNGRHGFRKNFVYKNTWLGKYYQNKQIEVFAVESGSKWIVITVIVKYF